MRLSSFIIILLLAGLVSSCSCNRNSKKNTSDSSVQLIKNDRYHYSFELPTAWSIKENSDNGDGYFLQSGYPEIDIRIYAQQIVGQDNEDDCLQSATFSFDDGTHGTQCFYSKSEYFIYKYNNKIQLSFYIDANEDWIKENQLTLDKIARSMKFIDEKGNF